MSELVAHLRRAALGEEEPDKAVEVLGALDGPCDAVVFLPGQVVVAADLEESWATDALAPLTERRPEDRSRGLAGFVGSVVERLGGPSACVSVLAVAPRRAALLRGSFTPARTPDPGWAPYRSHVVSQHFDSPGVVGTVDIGRGPGGRYDTAVRVDGDARGGGGDSRQLLAAALTLVPRGEDLYVSAPVHDVRALRTMLAGGFRPLGTEILFLTRPGATGEGTAPAAAATPDEDRSPGLLSRLFGGRKR